MATTSQMGNPGGVKYFLLSTDEPYFVGMADNDQFHSKARAKELGSRGKLLAQFVTKAAGYLHDRGRTVIFWGEDPLAPSDIESLPSYLVNGELEEANGGRFLNVIDDVKDELPVRTVDMSYLVYREIMLRLRQWFNQVEAARNRYAQAHNLPVRTDQLEWKNTRTPGGRRLRWERRLPAG